MTSGRTKLPELLAPAGSRKAFLGALKAGADAVYLGGEKFGARAYAENFTQEVYTGRYHKIDPGSPYFRQEGVPHTECPDQGERA